MQRGEEIIFHGLTEHGERGVSVSACFPRDCIDRGRVDFSDNCGHGGLRRCGDDSLFAPSGALE